jgi:hypothetical protein
VAPSRHTGASAALVQALQVDLDCWLVQYHTEQPHLGYRNWGKRPLDAVAVYPTVSQEAS